MQQNFFVILLLRIFGFRPGGYVTKQQIYETRSLMWIEAIEAIKTSDEDWIKKYRLKFKRFFEEQNDMPAGGLNLEARDVHYRSKLFKMFLSKDLNGLELPLQTGSLWIEEASALEGNWGWLLAIGAGGAYFADHMPEKIAHKYFCPEEALIAGSGKPDGKAEEISDGLWKVTGKWEYCSGSEQASVYTAVTIKMGRITAIILPKDKIGLVRDWNTFGLPLTCSHTIKAENSSIPSDHFFDLSTPPRPSSYPLGNYPFNLFALACFVPVVVGISRAFWDWVEEYLTNRKQIWQNFQPERYDLVFNSLQEYRQQSGALKSNFYERLEKSWKNHIIGGDPSADEVGNIGRDLVEFCFKSCSEIHPHLGMQVLNKTHPVQTCWQNLQVAYQHGIFHTYRM